MVWIPRKAFLDWRRAYGSVFTYWMGELPVVVVADFESMNESFEKDGDAYSQRPSFVNDFHKLTRGGTLGIISNTGQVWQEHRRFAIHAFKDLGMGNEICEKKILTEISSMISALKEDLVEESAELIVPNEHIDLALGSIINSIMFGLSFCHQKDIIYGAIRELQYCFDHLFQVFDAEITEHKRQRETSSEDKDGEKPSDFLHAYLNEVQKYERKGVTNSFSQEQLQNVCFDLWVAGQENVSTTIAWGIAHMLWNPSIQKQLHDELDKQTSSSTLIRWNDRKQLPFTNAVVAEFQRIANLVPQNLLHSTSRDVLINGIKIPSGTTIVPQISAVLYDDKVFSNPLQFNPARFLDEEGKFREPKEFVPFSMGKRRCAGEQLARMELFLFVANLFSYFEFSPGREMPNLKRSFGPAAQCPTFSSHIDSLCYAKYSCSLWSVPPRNNFAKMECIGKNCLVHDTIQWTNLCIVLMFTGHYINRAFLYPYLIRGGKPMAWHIFYHAKHANYSKNHISSITFLFGFVIYLSGMLINCHSDNILRNLRKPTKLATKYRMEVLLSMCHVQTILEKCWNGSAMHYAHKLLLVWHIWYGLWATSSPELSNITGGTSKSLIIIQRIDEPLYHLCSSIFQKKRFYL
uniref:Steroid 5-alpha reductase C-terminal domain-containing protein n=1 Tax=Ditylenchus dipsaci TaxID=166011 RepID=A0A915DMA4_9BILA